MHEKGFKDRWVNKPGKDIATSREGYLQIRKLQMLEFGL